MSLVQLFGFVIPIADVSREAGDVSACKVEIPSGFAAHEYGERKLAMCDLVGTPVVALERLRQRLWRFIVEGNFLWVGKRRLKRPQDKSLLFDFGVPFADVYKAEICGHRLRSDIIEESIGEHFYIWSRVHAELIERSLSLLPNDDQLPASKERVESTNYEESDSAEPERWSIPAFVIGVFLFLAGNIFVHYGAERAENCRLVRLGWHEYWLLLLGFLSLLGGLTMMFLVPFLI